MIPLQLNIGLQSVVLCACAFSHGLSFLPFADLVVIAKEFYPIPFRTRPSKPSASMVLRLKPRESRTLPGLPRAEKKQDPPTQFKKAPREKSRGAFVFSGPQESRIAIAPSVSKAMAAMRCQLGDSFRTRTEISAANRIEVSRSAATAATGARVIAHKAMP